MKESDKTTVALCNNSECSHRFKCRRYSDNPKKGEYFIQFKPDAWNACGFFIPLSVPEVPVTLTPLEQTLEEIAAYLNGLEVSKKPKDIQAKELLKICRKYIGTPEKNLLERSIDTKELCKSMYEIAKREGTDTNWKAFRAKIRQSLGRQVRAIRQFEERKNKF